MHERESKAQLGEGLRQRRRQDQPRQHDGEEHQPHRYALGIEPVGDPGGVDPHPPDGHQQKQSLDCAERGITGEQRVGELGYRKNEDEIEE